MTRINYLEFYAPDLEKIKSFYNSAFGWEFTDYGDDYVAFSSSGVDGGFARCHAEICNGVLVILYHEDLEAIKARVIKKGGKITQDIFSFPGGKRFHFADPAGNELAIWSDK